MWCRSCSLLLRLTLTWLSMLWWTWITLWLRYHHHVDGGGGHGAVVWIGVEKCGVWRSVEGGLRVGADVDVDVDDIIL